MKQIFYLFVSLTLLSGCGPRYSDFFMYHDDGTIKPKVVMLPVSAWERSEGAQGSYLSDAITRNVRENGQLFFYSDEEIQNVLSRVQGQNDLASVSCYFRPADFVVETLIVKDSCERSPCPVLPGIAKNPMEHVVRLRLQIMDIRHDPAKVVLLEMLEEKEIVIMRENYRAPRSCLYDTLAEKAATRIEEGILWRVNCQ